MKKKIVGIFVCMLLIATAIPVVGIINEEENHQKICNRGGIFRQYPSPYDEPMPEG